MNLTPLDVRKATFRKVIRGLDQEEVSAFLEIVAENYERVLQDNAKLNERIQGLDDRIRQYQGMERLLQDSMLTAERLATESRETTQREAEKLLEEAQKRSERILEDSRERLRNLNREIRQLAQRKELYIERFRSMIQTQAVFLEDHQQDLDEVDRLGGEVADLLAFDAGNRSERSELEFESEARDVSRHHVAMEAVASMRPEPGSRTPGPLPRIEPLRAFPEDAGADGPSYDQETEDRQEHPGVTPGFFPPRVRRQGFFDLKSGGGAQT